MVELEIIIPLKFLSDKKHRVSVPSSWNELSRSQLESIAGLLAQEQKSVYAFRIKVLEILAKLSKMTVFQIGAERLVDLFAFVEWVEQDIELTDNKVLDIKCKGVRFMGPIGDFSSLTCGEWTDADEAYLDYLQTNKEESLDRLMAILYRERDKKMSPKNPLWKNDYRLPYTEATVKGRIPYMARIPMPTKLAVLFWWKGCRQEWEAVFERVFKDKGAGPESFGWQETVIKLSGAEFGDLEKTQSTAMYKLMLKMEITIKDDEYQQQQMKAHAH
jgi:hypothetical protein